VSVFIGFAIDIFVYLFACNFIYMYRRWWNWREKVWNRKL